MKYAILSCRRHRLCRTSCIEIQPDDSIETEVTDCPTNEVPFSLLGYERQSVSKRLGCGGELAHALGQICPYQMPGRIGRQYLTALYGLGVFHFGDR